MANRYSNITPSQFNPLSLQEIMATPLMQRQKHDQLIAQQEMLRQGLAKVDPLDVHMNEALNVKSQMENKLRSQAELLSKEGINPNTQGEFLALNREYQNLISPTGRLGQINAAKQIYNANLKEFLDTAEKQGIGSNRALQLWQERNLNKYTGYDNNKNIANIGKLGVAAKQDYESDLSKYHSILGKTTTSAANSGYRIVDSGQGDGSKVMIDRSGNIKYDSNIDQLNNALRGFSQKWLTPQGEGFQYARDAGLNITPERVQSDFNAMMETSKIDTRGENAQYIAAPKPTGLSSNKGSMFNDAIQDPTTIKNLDTNTGEIDFKLIGANRSSTGGVPGQFVQNINKVKSSYKDILPPIQQKFYETAAKRLIESGRLPKNADLNNTANAEKIGFYMKNHMKIPTVASDIIRADVAIDNKLFSGNLASKDQTSRNRTLTQDLRQTENGTPLRTMLDVETGEKVKFETGDKVDYLGVESPINYSNYGFKNKFEQSVMGHRAQILDKDGNVKANVVISRTPNEMKDPTFKKMYEVNQIYKNGLNNLGEWVKPTGKYSGSKELSKTKVKVNDDNTFQIEIEGYGQSPKMNNEQFIQNMQLIMEN